MITTPSTCFIILLLTVLLVVVGARFWFWDWTRRRGWTSSSPPSPSSSPSVGDVDEKTSLIHHGKAKKGGKEEKRNEDEGRIEVRIEPLKDFDWKTTEPLRFRPFKEMYHITMALQASTPSDLILIDSNYLSRIHYRRHILSKHESEVIGCLPEGKEAVRELYSYLLGEYLVGRYPSMFRKTGGNSGTTTTTIFENLVTGAKFEVVPTPEDPLECLRRMAVTVEDDFYVLLPFPAPETEHRAVAFLNLHPSGFSPASKLSLPLSQIHSPVPSYSKIGPSLERFFSRLTPNTLTKRVNWSIQLHSELYSPSGNHVHEHELGEVEEVEGFGDEEAEEGRLRVEVQSVFALPGGKGEGVVKVFGFKTYLYSLKEVKGEEMGEVLARAIEGLREGNAPGMWRYKGAVRWGRGVTGWLRT
ncbi:hypothetical protein B0T20DRAFT_449352 [Sordaria brevicollis]|uniref:Uncharacterized protein n=1 Tax=Sordaria brevicollis TaxID=83679 RepID=A0AAE0NRH3_SORBR|nr:hypothetical protein B0T20DRAFT_449352 [Sordaria brevicollis]